MPSLVGWDTSHKEFNTPRRRGHNGVMRATYRWRSPTRAGSCVPCRHLHDHRAALTYEGGRTTIDRWIPRSLPPVGELGPLELSPGEIHVWRVLVELGDEDAARRASELLSAEERDRAARFRRAPDRARFVVARSRFREMIGGYLGVDPAALAFEAGPHGKPSVVGAPRFGVSIARSGRVVLMGAALDAELGIDVERVDREFPWGEVASVVFDEPEREAITRLAEPERTLSAFELWVHKEALAKMAGILERLPVFRVGQNDIQGHRLQADKRPSRTVLGPGIEKELAHLLAGRGEHGQRTLGVAGLAGVL